MDRLTSGYLAFLQVLSFRGGSLLTISTSSSNHPTVASHALWCECQSALISSTALWPSETRRSRYASQGICSRFDPGYIWYPGPSRIFPAGQAVGEVLDGVL